MTEPRISYSAYPDTSPEMEASVVANVYRFLLDRKNNATGIGHAGGDDAKKGSSDDRARTIIPNK
jgi:hypothetical protein